MSIICDECDGSVCREHPERCNPNMTAAAKLEAIAEKKANPKCPCETEALHETREVDGVKVTLDIDIKGEGLIRIRAVGQEPLTQYCDNKVLYQKPLPATAGFAIICDYCPVCGRKLKGEQDGKNES